MTEERGFEGFVHPFAAGIFLATVPAIIRTAYFPIACTLSLASTAGLILSVSRPVRLKLPASAVRILLGMLGLSSGVFCGFSSTLLGLSSVDSGFSLWASGVGEILGEAIDGIPFSNSDTNALIKALIIGDRNGIPHSITEAFRDSGASHILSLSGFHLGIVYGIVRWSSGWIGNSRKASILRSVLIISLCGFYTLATGAGPSIVRAFLFILLGEASRISNRRKDTGTLLTSALFIQLQTAPSSIKSVGFQLSYAAMSGIAYVYPWLRDFWPGRAGKDRFLVKGVRWIWNSAALSISCQLTTAPLVWFYFESFPKYFLLTNLIALPLSSIIIPFALAALLLSVLDICPQFLLTATEALTTALTFSLDIIAGM